MISDRVRDEREYAHDNFAAILDSLASAHQVNAWTRPQIAPPQPWTDGTNGTDDSNDTASTAAQRPPAQPPRETLPVKPADSASFLVRELLNETNIGSSLTLIQKGKDTLGSGLRVTNKLGKDTQRIMIHSRPLQIPDGRPQSSSQTHM